MEKRKSLKRQFDLFSHAPENIQWEQLSETNRHDIQQVLAMLLVSSLSNAQFEFESKERAHANKNQQ